MYRLILTLALMLIAQTAYAEQCRLSEMTCLEYDTITVGGVVIEDACVQVQKVSDCTLSDPVNTCTLMDARTRSASTPLRNNQCRLIENVCSDYAFGECVEWARSYECFNAPALMGEAVLEDRAFSNLQETFDNQCSEIEADPDCSFEHSITTEGFQTRNINARDVTRSWWSREHRYDCSRDRLFVDCQDLDALPICRQTGDAFCIEHDSNGRCIATFETFLCESDTSFAPQCAIVEVCEDGSCDPEPDEVSEDFGNATAWLNFLDSAAKTNTCEVESADTLDPDAGVEVEDCIAGTFEDGHIEPLVFDGQLRYCESGLFNRCSDSDYLNARIQAGATHYLRSQCRGLFCLKKRIYYCTYNSKFARVFQEQAHLQTGAQFTNACPGLTIAQLETLDIEAMDLSEVFGDMLDSADQPVQDLVIERLSQDMGLFQLDVEDTLGGDGQ